MGKVWAVVSGKGGAGRSTLTAMLGLTFARMGKHALLLDLNAGLRNLDMLLGLENRVAFDVGDVLEGIIPVEQAVFTDRNRPGLSLLSAPQFSEEALGREALRKLAQKLAQNYDAVIVDTPAGIGMGLDAALYMADEALLLACPDDASMRIADRVNGLIRRRDLTPRLIVQRYDPLLAQKSLHHAPDVVAMTLDLPLYAAIPEDMRVPEETLRRALLEKDEPERRLQMAVSQLAERMLAMDESRYRFEDEPMPEALPTRVQRFSRLFARKKVAH